MRTRHRCTKCDHDRILHVPDPRDTDQDRMAIGGIRSLWSNSANGALEAFTCMKCGYTELYVKSPGEIDMTKLSDGARVLGPADRGDPYR